MSVQNVAPDPHHDAAVLSAGAGPAQARRVAILIHGPGGSAEQALALGQQLALADVALLAPSAPEGWWPRSFLASIETNEPYFGSAMRAVESLVADILGQGVPTQRIIFAGFCQGGCLALEHVARAGRRYGGVVGMSAGLIGTGEAPAAFPLCELYGHRDKVFDYPQGLDGMPVSLSCRIHDPLMPLKRVEDTARIMAGLGAEIYTYFEPGAGHAILQNDVRALRALLSAR
ncbi:phospholipase [Acuticoccus sp. MNP-M23]|uniref:alpha/beta hydrolase n=1 Tax=Acuticoccus sp. MNP-M23 TaxID=3072793 RepID=UPI0028161D9F|nr:phospholipase [Acuticoccus sp. MNP-M23]WMS44221.1 phospholipase [Acuticoccus sp. MNP-M23]